MPVSTFLVLCVLAGVVLFVIIYGISALKAVRDRRRIRERILTGKLSHHSLPTQRRPFGERIVIVHGERRSKSLKKDQHPTPNVLYTKSGIRIQGALSSWSPENRAKFVSSEGMLTKASAGSLVTETPVETMANSPEKEAGYREAVIPQSLDETSEDSITKLRGYMSWNKLTPVVNLESTYQTSEDSITKLPGYVLE